MTLAQRRINAEHALQVRLMARLARLRPGREQFSEFVADEIAVETGWSRTRAASMLALAVDLCARLPVTLGKLESGEIDWPVARRMHEATAVLTDAQAGAVEQVALAGDVSGRTLRQISDRVRRAVLRIDPDATRRHREAVKARRVTVTPADDGMAELWALLPAEAALVVYQRVDALASKGPADGRTADQRRADALVDLVLGSGAQQVAVRVDVTVPAVTLAGGTQPGELAGYGPIDADTARLLAAGGFSRDTTWRRLLTDPVSGAVLDVGRRRYRPPAALAEHVRVRDRSCVFPGCVRPASSCDLDHTVAWEDGGTTSHRNLAPLCRHHHRLKHEGGWGLSQHEAGVYCWTSPTGRGYRTGSAPHLEWQTRSGAPSRAAARHGTTIGCAP
jgi:Domain of unknown function (DUF222)/HNH endonuclease